LDQPGHSLGKKRRKNTTFIIFSPYGTKQFSGCNFDGRVKRGDGNRKQNCTLYSKTERCVVKKNLFKMEKNEMEKKTPQEVFLILLPLLDAIMKMV
jgi:hypothetical protein